MINNVNPYSKIIIYTSDIMGYIGIGINTSVIMGYLEKKI
jgi:hypothetical protein